MSVKQLIGPANRAFTSNGFPAPGATVSLYLSGTLTPANFYADTGLVTPLGPTLTANGAGRFETPAYQDEFTAFRIIYRDAGGVQLDDIDPFFFGYEGPRGPQGIQGDVAKVLTRTELSQVAVGGQASGLTRYLTESGREGIFVWSTDDLSTQVAADTGQGIYVAPGSGQGVATDGSEGAWKRDIPDGIYLAEWWLPDVMPADAETYLNVVLNDPNSIVPSGSKFVFPARQTTLTGPIICRRGGIVIEGFGSGAPLWANDTATECLIIAADDVTCINLWAGNTVGAEAGPESPAFHIYDAWDKPNWDGTLKRIGRSGFLNCGALDCETGFRIGYSADNSLLGGTNEVFESYDCFVDHCVAETSGLRGIEAFNSRRPRITNNVIRMGSTLIEGGGCLGIRVNSCQGYIVEGNRIVGASEVSSSGIVLDVADTKPDTYLASRDGQVALNTFENCGTDIVAVAHDGSLIIANNTSIGRTDGETNFLSISTVGSAHTRKLKLEHALVIGNVVQNKARFAFLGGTLNMVIRGNQFISNDYSDPHPLLFDGHASEQARVQIEGNRFLANTTGLSNYPIQLQGTFDAGSTILTFDGNELTGGLHGSAITPTPGNVTMRVRNPKANRVLIGSASVKWATSTAYVAGDVRLFNGISWVCLANHTSGTFSTDLNNSLWAVESWSVERTSLGLAEYN